MALKGAPFHDAGGAQRTVTVPEDSNIFLQVSFDSAQKPSLLTAYGPNFFTGLKFQNVDNDDQTIAEVSKLTGLRMLDLRESGITDKGMIHLAKLPNLEYLKLDDVEITDAGLACLQNLTQLKSLQLDGTRITNHSLTQVQKCKQLRMLTLNRCNISDRALPVIKSLPELEHLELRYDHQITAKGLLQLAGMKKLRALDLSYTGVKGDDIAVIEKLCKSLPALQVIKLTDKSFSNEIAQRIKRDLPKIQFCVSQTNMRDVPIAREDLGKVFAPLHSWTDK